MGVDIRVRVKGGGHVSQIYGERNVCVHVCVVTLTLVPLTAIRQAISKSLVAYYQKCKLT